MTKNIQIGDLSENYETLVYATVLLSMIGIVIVSVLRSAAFM